MGRPWIAIVWLFVLGLAGCSNSNSSTTLLNVSYDPTRELWKELNQEFTAHYSAQTGQTLTIQQSHGGSASQARAIIDGLEADVATLAMWADTDAIRKKGLLAEGWADRLPNRSLPYISTIVFVVRKGNPKNIKDWPDLVQGDVEVVTPNPKTGGNGKLSFLAAWGSVLHAGKSDEDAAKFVQELYRRIPVLDSAARAATVTFSKKGIGDVHLTWENEAHLEVQEAKGELEIVYPSSSIRAEPHVAWIDGYTERHGTTAIARQYLEFLYTPKAQGILAKHHYRPNASTDPKLLEQFAPITLFPITVISADWDAAHDRFFVDGGVFDQIYEAKSP